MNDTIAELAHQLRMELRKAGLSEDVRIIIATSRPRDWELVRSDPYLWQQRRFCAPSDDSRRIESAFAEFRLEDE